MELNSKTLYLHQWQRSWVLKRKSTHHHTDLNRMEVLEGFHKFLKASFAKHISRHKEWDEYGSNGSSIIQLFAKSTFKGSPRFL